MRNPVGTHVLVGPGLVKGALAQAELLGCETLQLFTGNPRGWALSPGDPAVDGAFREACAERGMRTFIHAPYLVIRPSGADAVAPTLKKSNVWSTPAVS